MLLTISVRIGRSLQMQLQFVHIIKLYLRMNQPSSHKNWADKEWIRKTKREEEIAEKQNKNM